MAAALLAASAAQPAKGDDAAVRANLAALSSQTVFFGHQSVGVNLLDGLRALAARHDVALRIVAAPASQLPGPGAVVHAFVGRNTDPSSKLRDFERALSSGPAARPDLALVKFCYVDVTTATDAARLFAEYQASVARIRAAAPGTTLVHVTVPLTTVQGGVRGALKRLLGRAPGGFLENARREEFNALLRASYLGREPLFDLARLESTREGRPETAEWRGRTVPALLPEFTADGGHLNREGQLRAARELAAVLAAASTGRRQASP
jgi:hypothetical protein